MNELDPTIQAPVYGPGSPPGDLPRRVEDPKEILRLHDFPVQLMSKWDVPTAMAALDAHAMGQFYNSGLLADAMTADDAFSSVVNTRVFGLISRPFKLKKSKNGNKVKARLAHRLIAKYWETILPEETQAAIVRTAAVMGFALCQLVWRVVDKLWVPSIQLWHPSLVYYRTDTRTYVVNTMEGMRHVYPGTGQWMLYTPHGQYRGWLEGAVRTVAIPWMVRQYAWRDWARYSEVHGLPIKKAKVPSQAEGADKLAFTTSVNNLGNQGTVVLPQGIDGNPALSYDLDLIEATAKTWDGFQALIQKCDERIAIRMLGQNLTTQVDAGSLAAANVHDRVRLDYTRYDAKTLSCAIRAQILEPFCEYNLGSASAAPEPYWDCKPPEDETTKSQVLVSVSQAVANFVTSGAPVDLRAFLDTHKIPTLESVDDAVLPPYLRVDGAGNSLGTPGAPPPGSTTPVEEGSPANQAPPETEPRTHTRLSIKRVAFAQQKSNLRGQRYVDEVAAKAAVASQKHVASHVKNTMAALKGATSYDDARKRLKAVLADANPKAFAETLATSILLTTLAGRLAGEESER